MRSAVTAGTILAGFRLESLIGEGAMGAVYLAEDTKRSDLRELLRREGTLERKRALGQEERARP